MQEAEADTTTNEFQNTVHATHEECGKFVSKALALKNTSESFEWPDASELLHASCDRLEHFINNPNLLSQRRKAELGSCLCELLCIYGAFFAGISDEDAKARFLGAIRAFGRLVWTESVALEADRHHGLLVCLFVFGTSRKAGTSRRPQGNVFELWAGGLRAAGAVSQYWHSVLSQYGVATSGSTARGAALLDAKSRERELAAEQRTRNRVGASVGETEKASECDGRREDGGAMGDVFVHRDALSGKWKTRPLKPAGRSNGQRDGVWGVYSVESLRACEAAMTSLQWILGLREEYCSSDDGSNSPVDRVFMGHWLGLVLRVLEVLQGDVRAMGLKSLMKLAITSPAEEIRQFSVPVFASLRNALPLYDEAKEAGDTVEVYCDVVCHIIARAWPAGAVHDQACLQMADFFVRQGRLLSSASSASLRAMLRHCQRIIRVMGIGAAWHLQDWCELIFEALEGSSASTAAEGLRCLVVLLGVVSQRVVRYSLDIFARLAIAYTSFVCSRKPSLELDSCPDDTDSDVSDSPTSSTSSGSQFVSPVAAAFTEGEWREVEEHRDAISSLIRVSVERLGAATPDPGWLLSFSNSESWMSTVQKYTGNSSDAVLHSRYCSPRQLARELERFSVMCANVIVELRET